MPIDTVAAARGIEEQVIAWRRDLHQHPELGLEEHRTTALIVEQLARMGFAVERPLPTGAVGVLAPPAGDAKLNASGPIAVAQPPSAGNRPQARAPVPHEARPPVPHEARPLVSEVALPPGPADETLAFRADIDALAMEEGNPDLDFRSQTPGVCHACGHDAHTAILLGTASVIAAHRGSLTRRVKVIFQPCEERLPGGAAALVEAGVVEDVAMIFGLHVDPTLPAGTFEARPGPMMAAADEVRITVTGRGGHGAAPHLTVDPIPVAAQLVLALQGIVSRRTDPLESAVVSICQINAGSAFNVIPDAVTMVGTVRTLKEAVRARMPALIEETAQGVAASAGAHAQVQYRRGHPALVNDPKAAERALAAITRCWGPHAAVQRRPPKMGAEDFACFCQATRGCYLYLGVGNAAIGAAAPHHSPQFRLDESVLWMGPALFADLALNG